MKKILLLACVLLSGCAMSHSYQDIYDGYRARGLTHTQAINAADAYCMDGFCSWGK